MENVLLKEFFGLISQAPLVALFAYLWWRTRQDFTREVKYLEERSKHKDERIKELINVIDKFTVSLELIKDRLR